MFSPRIRSGSCGGVCTSTSSIAGEMPAIAAAAVSRSAPAATSRPICTAISGSATGFAQPASEMLPPDRTRAFCVKNPTSGPLMPSCFSMAGAPKPTFQANDLSPPTTRWRRRPSCSCMPRTTRGSSQSFIAGSMRACLRTLMTLRVDLVAGRLDRSGSHPTPHQQDVLVRRVVEAVPAPARRIDHVAFARGLLAAARVDVAVTLEHDEELVAIVVAVTLVSRPGLEHRPGDHTVDTGSCFVTLELQRTT